MAQLNVEPKKNNNWWIWLVLALVALGLLFFLLRGCNDNKTETSGADTTTTTAVDPVTDDWSGIDRSAPAAAYEEITDTSINVRGNENYAIYSVEEVILFDTDKNELKSDATDKLKQIAASAEKRFAGGQVRIYGYTDSTGTAAHNKELAEQRAQAVQNWLVQNGSITQERVSLNPVGEAQPAATNATEEGRAQNRRVEIVVRKQQ